MLRQWFKGAATIVLSLDGIAVRTAGSDEIRIIHSSKEPYSPEAMLAALEAQASELELKRVRFILSNQLVRYAVLSWQTGVYAMQEWLALAAHQFRNQFGTVADSWDIRVALQGYEMPAVACALDHDLAERLQALSVKAGWVVQGIEPALMAVFNQHRSHFNRFDHWILMAEPQRLLLGQINNGTWQHFYVDSPPAGEEPMACQRMVEHTLRLLGGESPVAVACFGPVALLPENLANGIKLLRLPCPVSGEGKMQPNVYNLNMLAEVA